MYYQEGETRETKEIAEKLAACYGTRNPYELAKFLNIHIQEGPLGKIHACTLKLCGQQFLYLNSNLASCRRKVLTAHALGQLISHDDAICIISLKTSEQCTCAVSKRRCLAAELLYEDSESPEFTCCRAIRWHTLLDFKNAVTATRAG